jgi:hypothetical protein
MIQRDPSYWDNRKQELNAKHDVSIYWLLLLFGESYFIYLFGILLAIDWFINIFLFLSGCLSGFLLIRMEFSRSFLRTFNLVILGMLFVISILFTILGNYKFGLFMIFIGSFVYYAFLLIFYFLGYWTGTLTQYSIWQIQYIKTLKDFNTGPSYPLPHWRRAYPFLVFLAPVVLITPYPLTIYFQVNSTIILFIIFLLVGVSVILLMTGLARKKT